MLFVGKLKSKWLSFMSCKLKKRPWSITWSTWFYSSSTMSPTHWLSVTTLAWSNAVIFSKVMCADSRPFLCYVSSKTTIIRAKSLVRLSLRRKSKCKLKRSIHALSELSEISKRHNRAHGGLLSPITQRPYSSSIWSNNWLNHHSMRQAKPKVRQVI